ncbi:hypothetical protein GOP47_0006527 [Adiantum capillus-veneris]|uniref:Uncharacterized protein n=1 Tax=Adiantum capillus-veneris TaxID=13818 RepID=A0A9D4V320_ADICA|nr:hypothetical protein GOP47_0006527 [Adiantum capillus-veneris]
MVNLEFFRLEVERFDKDAVDDPMSEELDEEIICDPEPEQAREVKDMPLKISSSRNVESKILHNNANSTDSSSLRDVPKNSTEAEIKYQSQEKDISMCSNDGKNQKAKPVIKSDTNIVSPVENAKEPKVTQIIINLNNQKQMVHQAHGAYQKINKEINKEQCEPKAMVSIASEEKSQLTSVQLSEEIKDSNSCS